MRKSLMLCAAMSAIVSLVGSEAKAQQAFVGPAPSTLIAFGDSLTDNGNIFELTFGTIPPSPPYFQGRFSNGPTWAELFPSIAGIANSPNLNFAFGGAQSGSANPIDLQFQLANFFGSGGGAPSNALYSIWIGANDFNSALVSPNVNPAALIAGITNNIASAITQLNNAGAEQFLLFNLPDLGIIPLSAPLGPAAQASAGLLIDQYNTALVATAQALRGQLGIDIVIVDVETAFDQIIANPSAFGFSNVTTPCIISTGSPPATPTGACSTPAATAATLFFDLLHPTAPAHVLTAELAFASLVGANGAPRFAATHTQIALRAALEQTRQVEDDLLPANFVRREGGAFGGGLRTYVTGGYLQFEEDATLSQNSFDADGFNAAIGLEYAFSDHVLAGAKVGYTDANAEIGDTNGSLDLQSFDFLAYVAGQAGGFFANAIGQMSFQDLDDVERATGFRLFDTATGETEADVTVLAFTAGYSGKIGGLRVTPFGGFRYVDAEIDAYREEGGGPTSVEFAQQDAESVVARGGMEIGARFAMFGGQMDWEARGAFEREFANDNRDVTVNLSSGDFSTVFADAPSDNRGVFGAGLTWTSRNGLFMAADWTGQIDGSGFDDHSFYGRVGWRF